MLSMFHGVGIFLLSFFISMALGIVFGLGCSLMLKHSSVRDYPEIETCLIVLIAYTSYFFSNALTMSGKSSSYQSHRSQLTCPKHRDCIRIVLRRHAKTLRIS
jgi:ABC-type Fe3+ transport system permease subunit